MNENRASPNNLLDTTDCLEAVGVLKGWKNLLFIIMVLCIVLLQACFWLVDTGWIPIEQSSAAEMGQAVSSDEAILVAEPNLVGIGDVNDFTEVALEQNASGEPNQSLTLSEFSEPEQPDTKTTFHSLCRNRVGCIRPVHYLPGFSDSHAGVGDFFP